MGHRAAEGQRAIRHPAGEQSSLLQILEKERQLAQWRHQPVAVPLDMHATGKCLRCRGKLLYQWLFTSRVRRKLRARIWSSHTVGPIPPNLATTQLPDLGRRKVFVPWQRRVGVLAAYGLYRCTRHHLLESEPVISVSPSFENKQINSDDGGKLNRRRKSALASGNRRGCAAIKLNGSAGPGLGTATTEPSSAVGKLRQLDGPGGMAGRRCRGTALPKKKRTRRRRGALPGAKARRSAAR
jgi:hypothetical protein